MEDFSTILNTRPKSSLVKPIHGASGRQKACGWKFTRESLDEIPPAFASR